MLPENIIALYSNNNEIPTQGIDNPNAVVTGLPVSRQNDTIVFSTDPAYHDYNYGTPHYLGAIVNAETKEVYWVNDSQPLP